MAEDKSKEKPLKHRGVQAIIQDSYYDRYACLVHLGTFRRHCPICGAIYCPKCDPEHLPACRESNNVGN